MPNSTATVGTPVTAAPVGRAANFASAHGNGHSEVVADSGKVTQSFTGSAAVVTYTGNGDFGLVTGYIQSDAAGRGVIRVTTNQVFTYDGTDSTLVSMALATNANVLRIDAPSVTMTTGTLTGLGAGSTALLVKATGGAGVGDIDVTVDGDVSGAKRGIALEQTNTGTNGDVNLTSTAGNSITAGAGNGVTILAKGSGTISVDLADLVSATGGDGIAIRGAATGGDISIQTAAVSAFGAQFDALDVLSLSATADVAIVAEGAIHAAHDGVFGSIRNATATGDLSITTNSSIDVGHNGIEARNLGKGLTTIAVNGGLTADNEGVVVISSNPSAGAISVTTAAGQTLNVGADGIDIETFGSGNVDVVNAAAMTSSGTGDITLDDGIDINADGTGSVTVNNSGAIGTVGDRARENGMDLSIANAASAGTFSVTGTGAIFSVDTGIDVSTRGSGAISVVYSGAIDTTTGHGIQIDTTSGAITVSNSGAINTPGGNGIEANSSTGSQTITVGANITAGDNAVDMSSGGSKAVIVAAGRTLSGDLGVASTGTGATTITNSGTVTGTLAAISSATSATTVNNLAGGTVNGAINLSGLNDSVTNHGIIDGALTLAAGADLYDGRNGSISGTVNGGDGNDTLRGGAGAETMIGGLGADILEGNGGSDNLTGGADNDTFRGTAAGLNSDRIMDLAAGDKIVITDADLAGFSFSFNGNMLTYTGGSLTLTGFTGELQASAAAGGGVELTVVQNSAAAMLASDFKSDAPDEILWQDDSDAVPNWFGQAKEPIVSSAYWDTVIAQSWQVQPDLII